MAKAKTDPTDETVIDPETVVEQAKASFSLTDRLAGMKLASAKVLVFTDLEAAEAWALAEATATKLGGIVNLIEPGDAKHQAALDDFTKAEEAASEARSAAFASALALHMRAVPQVALDAAARKARKELRDDTGQIPEEARQAFFDRQNELLLGQVVLRIVDAEGREADFDRKGLSRLLRDTLPVPQFDRVMAAYNRLMFNDTLARAATSDPGF